MGGFGLNYFPKIPQTPLKNPSFLLFLAGFHKFWLTPRLLSPCLEFGLKNGTLAGFGSRVSSFPVWRPATGIPTAGGILAAGFFSKRPVGGKNGGGIPKKSGNQLHRHQTTIFLNIFGNIILFAKNMPRHLLWKDRQWGILHSIKDNAKIEIMQQGAKLL